MLKSKPIEKINGINIIICNLSYSKFNVATNTERLPKNNNIQINSLCFDEISNLYNEILQNIESLILKNDIYNL